MVAKRGKYAKRSPQEIKAVQAAIVGFMEQGNSFRRACELAGVSRQTAATWTTIDKEFLASVQEAEKALGENLEEVLWDAALGKLPGIKTTTRKTRTSDGEGGFDETSESTVDRDLVKYSQWMLPRLDPEQWSEQRALERAAIAQCSKTIKFIMGAVSDPAKEEIYQALLRIDRVVELEIEAPTG